MSEHYEVVYSDAIRDAFRSIANKGLELDQPGVVGAAMKWIMEELARTPLEFGESRGSHRASGLQYRVGFVMPLTVMFGVHEATRQVFIGWIRAKF